MLRGGVSATPGSLSSLVAELEQEPHTLSFRWPLVALSLLPQITWWSSVMAASLLTLQPFAGFKRGPVRDL